MADRSKAAIAIAIEALAAYRKHYIFDANLVARFGWDSPTGQNARKKIEKIDAALAYFRSPRQLTLEFDDEEV